jgi:hypothetical protein
VPDGEAVVGRHVPGAEAGPQKQERMEAPEDMREEMTFLRVSSIMTGMLAG